MSLPRETVSLRRVLPAEVTALARLVRAYHASDGIDSELHVLPEVLLPLLQDEGRGCVWFVEAGGNVAGYLAICFGYSIEFGGRDAFVDELYLEDVYRGRGIGSRALDLGIAEARALGAKALHLEVDTGNEPAQKLYRSRGFVPRERYRLMSQVL